VRSNNFYQLLQDLRSYEGTERVEPFGEYLHLTTKDGVAESTVNDFLQGKGHENIAMKRTEATIEDVFLDLM